jgi:PHD/YefM family antitoxin component YafN of YafNO toxin-antitoxin module
MVRTKDVVSITEARAKLTELAEEIASAGAEKLLTKNGASFVALIDARKLDYYHALEAEHANIVLRDEVERGLADVAAGRTTPAKELRRRLRR